MLVCAIDDGMERQVAGYFPELNPLIPLSYHDKASQTPAYKGVPV
jgi:hypothetical protein